MHTLNSRRTNLSLLLFFVFIVSACTSSAPRGPYLQLGTPESMVIKWVTDEASTGTVFYGLTEDQLTEQVSSVVNTRDHELQLTGLNPNTEYFYKFESSDGTQSEVYSFVTAPPIGSQQPIRVWLIGDSGTADENAIAVRDDFYDYNNGATPDLWIMLGDNAYPDGTQEEYQKAVFDIYPETLATSVVWPTLGNHDAKTLLGAPYYSIFTLPKSGEAGGVASGTEAYYSFDYGNIHFICLNSETVNALPGGAMYNWLKADLEANTQDWTIVYFHQPPYSKGSHDSDEITELKIQIMRKTFTPVFDDYGVDLVFSGHSHAYERSYPVAGHRGLSRTLTADMIKDHGDGREDGDGAYQKVADDTHDGVVYTVAGSSGKISGGSLDHPVHFISYRELGSVVLNINGNRLDAVFLSPTEGVDDHYTIIKN